MPTRGSHCRICPLTCESLQNAGIQPDAPWSHGTHAAILAGTLRLRSPTAEPHGDLRSRNGQRRSKGIEFLEINLATRTRLVAGRIAPSQGLAASQVSNFTGRIRNRRTHVKLAQRISQSFDQRRKLRGRTSFGIALADRFSQLNADSWRAVTRSGSFFHSAEYQYAFERFCPANIEPRYALICEGDVPLATVCMQVVRVDLHQFGTESRNKDLEKLRRRIQQRMLVCGNLLVY